MIYFRRPKVHLAFDLVTLIACCFAVYSATAQSQVRTKTKQEVLNAITDNVNTPLEPTLKFLKTELSRHGLVKTFPYPSHFKPGKFNACNISFRYTPKLPPGSSLESNSTRFPDEKEYSLNLGDLDPSSLTISLYDDGARILVGTWNDERKIKVLSKNPITGETIYANQPVQVINFDLLKTDTAQQIHDSLKHAIMLCQK